MGIGIVLLFWAVVCGTLAGIGMLVLGGSTAYLTRGVAKGRRRAIMAAGLFPFACLGWGALIFLVQWVVNESVFQRDPGLGDTWTCPLPNGYALLMIDVTDEGWIYNPKTQGTNGGVGEQEDAVAGVRMVQIAGQYILGGKDTNSFENRNKEMAPVDSYFLLDARTGKRSNFSTYEALREAALQLRIQPNLEPINAVYSRYRFTWFDVLVGILFFGALLLLRWIARLRKTRGVVTQLA
jgi:hypothetical protein